MSLNSRSAFIAFGLVVNVLLLLRSLILMTVLDYAELGLIALVQSTVLVIGMLHFGLLNGGYRLLCHANDRYRQRIIDLAWSVFAIVAGLIALTLAATAIALDNTELRWIAALTALGGMATLLRSWMTNEMVSVGKLAAANIISAVATLASLAALPFLEIHPALVATGSIVLHPIVFVMLAMVSGEVLRPRQWRFQKRLLKLIMRIGAVVFVAGLTVQLNTQMDRWFVTTELGLDQLGRLYLAFLFITLFQMFPTLLQQAFLPRIIQAWKGKQVPELRAELRNYLLLVTAYCLAAALAVWLIAPPLVELVLPEYVADLRWVNLLMPGLIAFTIAAGFTFVFFTVVDFTWYLVAFVVGTLATVVSLGAAWLGGYALDLDGVIVLRSAIYAVMGALLVLGWWRMTRRFPEFRVFDR
ncbi:MAG: hypothetical protein AAF250_06280 [Pseudomonadota bacterium]